MEIEEVTMHLSFCSVEYFTSVKSQLWRVTWLAFFFSFLNEFSVM